MCLISEKIFINNCAILQNSYILLTQKMNNDIMLVQIKKGDFSKMKKKITALALCLIMCLTLVLVSCSGAVSTFDIAEFEIEKQGSYNNDFSFDVLGDVDDVTDNLVFTSEDVDVEITEEDGSVTTKTNTIYRVYNLQSGKKVYEKTENYEIDDPEETDTTVVQVGITTRLPFYNNGYPTTMYKYDNAFFVILGQANDEGVLEAYDLNGKKLGTTGTMKEDDFDDYSEMLCAYSNTHFVANKVLYRIEEVENAETGALETKLAEVAKIEDIEALFDNYDGAKFKFVDNKYIAVDSNDSQATITVFDNKLEVLNYYELYTDVNTDIEYYYFLNNGNLVFYTINEVSVSDMIDGWEYDYIDDGDAVNVDQYVYDVESGSMSKNTEVTFLPEYVMAATDLEDADEMGFIIKVNGENIANGYEIVDGKLSTKRVGVILNNNGSVASVVDDFEGVNGSEALPVADGIYAVEFPYGAYLYTQDGEKIGKLPANVKEVNENWIITEEKIYDFNLKEIYTIPEDYEIENVGNEVVYLSYYQEEVTDEATGITTPGKTTYYIFTGSATLTTVGEIEDGKYDVTYNFKDEYYTVYTSKYNEETGETTLTREFKSAKDGKVLFTQSYLDGKMDVDVRYVEDGIVIIHETYTENEETGEITTTTKIHYITYKPASSEAK